MIKIELKGFYNIDCMEGMKNIPDKYFDLAMVDPPYFQGPNTRKYYGREKSKLKVKRKDYEIISNDNWEVPEEEYFNELLRVSKHQIIWGINYFGTCLGSGRIVWDKVNDGSSFSNCEIAYCSFHDSVRIFRHMWRGMFQGKSVTEGHIQQGDKSLNEYRIHPCQKPVNLYKWILKTYAKAGHKVLDTHVGSASSLIACEDLGFEYLGFEIDKHYYELANKRIEEFNSQLNMFN